ncbi:MAG: sodium-translocating pyrophosphatase [Planctomycetota bacterium]|jgi:K(+)-stimulated pyrophosphate-energized sodium pump
MFYAIPISALAALATAAFFFAGMKKASQGNATMQGIAADVRQGAFAYLLRQYRLVGIAFAALFVVFAILAAIGVLNPFTPLALLTGGIGSGLAGFIGMNTATHASARTAEGARQGLNRGLRVAFNSGAVMGLCVTGLALLDIAAWYLVLTELVYTPAHYLNGLSMFGLDIVSADPSLVVDGELTAAGNGARMAQVATTMVTFGVGASLQALFARVGGGIYTKAADVGADLVGKVEAGIPEDDPRNPATIADNVGDNVGDVAGMGADLYESYYGSILATAALGAILAKTTGDYDNSTKVVLVPMLVAAIGIISSIIGTGLVRTKEGASQKSLLHALLIGTAAAGILVMAGVCGLAGAGWLSWGLVGSIAAGLVAGVIVGQATEYYTAPDFKPTQSIADAAKMGPATTIISGTAVGMRSTGIPVLTVVIGILAAYGFAGGFTDDANAMLAGLYGVSLAAVGMLATLGITLATDAYGPIADNAGGNAEMAGLDPEVRERTDALDALGNTTAATGKGFAIGSAALTALALLASYVLLVLEWIGKDLAMDSFRAIGPVAFTRGDAGVLPEGLRAVDINQAGIPDILAAYELTLINPIVIAGLFIGAMAAFVFTAMTMAAVGRAAEQMVGEVRRQFREIVGIMDYTPGDDSAENQARRPDYAQCVAIATSAAQKEMLVPAVMAVALPVAVGLIMGVPGVLGLLAGALAAGFPLATFLNNAGGAWDNAKKSIECGRNGGKYLTDADGNYVDEHGNRVERREDAKNPVHAATVIGDTVGDPFKDTSGPALNILIKLMAVVSVVFCGVTVAYGLIG